jgi:hypothetical protein
MPLGPILPLRPLTAEETAGFRIALACMDTWARQIEGSPLLAKAPAGERRAKHRAARHIRAMTAALDRSAQAGRF